MITSLMALSLGACVPSEGIFDNTRIVGSVRTTPVLFKEKRAQDPVNGPPDVGIDIGEIGYGFWRVNGTLLTSAAEDDGDPAGDFDSWKIQTPVDRGDVHETGELPEDALPPVAIDVTLSDPAAKARFRWMDLDQRVNAGGPGGGTQPTELASFDITGWALIEVPMASGTAYAFEIAGVEGPDNVDYDVVISGQHPDEARILVGMYEEQDPAERGELLAGTNALPFAQVEGWAFEAQYEMLLVRKYTTPPEDEQGKTVLDEKVKDGWIHAATWNNLNQGLPGGTFYATEAIYVKMSRASDAETWGHDVAAADDTGATEEAEVLPGEPEYPTIRLKADEVVVLDNIAPVQIGRTIDEVEPNNVTNMQFGDPYFDASSLANAQDIGLLSGPGFVDILKGTGDVLSDEAGWVHDNDAFAFQVDAPTILSAAVDWDQDGADFDLLITREDGYLLDAAVSYDQPDVSAYYGDEVFEPGITYYMVIAPWNGTPGSAIPWDVRINQAGP